MFSCETRNKRAFVQTMCKKLRGFTRWKIVDPVRFKGSLLLRCSDRVSIQQLFSCEFCFEVQIEDIGTREFFGGFLYMLALIRSSKNSSGNI